MATTTKRRRPAPTSLAALLLSSLVSAAQTFPYVPTTVLLSPAAFPGGPSGRSESVAYIFHPTTTGVELLALNVSGTVSAGALQTIPSSLPFLENASATTAFLPAVADDGSVVVQAGDCAVDNGYDVWTYAGGEWRRTAATLPGDADSDAGPYALGAGISFSATLAPSMSKPVLYSFGGMCLSPTADEAWQENGTYTKTMLRVAPDGDAAYSASFVSGKGPAFPEAGFSFTPLSPSVSNRSGVVTQQNRYVLLGGHTRQAFINMSSAAIWNLPEESWSFATVGAPQASSELAIRRRSAENVESRSGHTAVLSEDGSALVVLGGWVGGVGQPASPQLAVLRMGDTYGDWAWEVPPEQPESGVYGHGATMLPGNVMMVYGGYEISASGSKTKRQAGGTGLRFLNMTSMAWTTSYASPSSGKSSAAEDAGTDMKKVGLGVGLGVGAAAVIGAVLVYLCYKRHLKRRTQARDETVRALAQDASHFLQPEDDMLERRDGGSYPWSSHAWYTGGHDPYDTGSRSLGYESLRNSHGAYQQQPPGLLIPRKPIPRAARGAYQPAANLTTPGHIHPIYEADEDDPDSARARYHQEDQVTTPTTPGYPADPFATPTSAAAPVLLPLARGSATPSPEASRRDPEVQDWQSDVDAAEALLAQMPVRRASSRNTARRSPSRRASMRSRASMADDERTASNLSESGRSVISIPTRSASARRDPGLSIVTEARVGTSSSSGSSSHTYSTAKTTFNALQAEGPSLLHRGQRPLGEEEEEEEEEDVPSSPSKHKPRRSLGWLGSLRRVFSVSPNDSSDSSGREDGNSARRVSLKDEPADDYEPRLGLSGIGGAELLRRKQGRRDWDADQRSVDEWDIEKAVEQRLVQVMFTVPKERLRVVNAEIEREEEVVLVDPDQDELEEDEKRALVFDEKGKGKAVLLDEEDITTARYGVRPESPESPRGRRMVHLPPPKDDDEEDRGSLLLRPGTRDESEPRPSLTLRTAEVVSVARPRTRVLEMVENIERSRESSPSL